jgi:hypothetical protein
MSVNKFMSPAEAREYYPEIFSRYRRGFGKKSIWGEEGKCPIPEPVCISRSNFCPVINEVCQLSGSTPTEPAYTDEELTARFDNIAETKKAVWYLEFVDDKLALAALAYRTSPRIIASERWPDVPAMDSWIESVFGPAEVIYLDEVFSDPTEDSPRIEGNLDNFVPMVEEFQDRLDCQPVAYRTISPAMVKVAGRFGNKARRYERSGGSPVSQEIDVRWDGTVPDRRDFVAIDARIKPVRRVERVIERSVRDQYPPNWVPST